MGASFSRTEAWSLVKLSKDMSGKPVVSTPSFKPLKSRKMRFGQGLQPGTRACHRAAAMTSQRCLTNVSRPVHLGEPRLHHGPAAIPGPPAKPCFCRGK